MSEPIAKRDGQRDKILVWLQMRGARGVLNTELNEICLRYGARLHELRQAGHNIRTDRLNDSRYRFVLEEETVKLKRIEDANIGPSGPIFLIDSKVFGVAGTSGHAASAEQSRNVDKSAQDFSRAEQQRLFA